MAIRRRNLSSPLAKSDFDYTVTPKKKKKRTVKVSKDKKTGGKTLTVNKRSGAKRSVAISGDGTRVTRTKTNRKGEQVRKKTTKLNLSKKPGTSTATTTIKKKGKPTKNYTVKEMTAKQANQVATMRDDFKKDAQRNVKKADKLYKRDTKLKADSKKLAKEEREEKKRNRGGPKKWARQAQREQKKSKRDRLKYKKKKARESGGRYGVTAQTGKKRKKSKSCPSGKVYDKGSCKGKSADGG